MRHSAIPLAVLLAACASDPAPQTAADTFAVSAEMNHNTLTDAQRAQGWRLLFDGRTTEHWRGFKRADMPPHWQVIAGELVHVVEPGEGGAGGGDIITREQFDDFELSLEWKVAPGGNSGIFFNVSEDDNLRFVWETGPEMQILDDTRHPDGQQVETSAGSNYALHARAANVAKPAGEWNHARILVRGNHVEHWLNGVKVVEYELGSEDWKRRVAASKFAEMPRYGTNARGHIALQDHGDRVAFRNLRIREL